MANKTLQEFHQNLSWSTRIYTLLTVVTIALSYIFDAWSTNFAQTIILALAIILFVETFEIMFRQHPKTFQIIKWIIILLALAFLLIGFKSVC